MPFYVPVGPKGIVFRLGTFLIAIVGPIGYWRSVRRRVAAAAILIETDRSRFDRVS